MSVTAKAYSALKDLHGNIQRKSYLADSYKFESRSQGRETLIVVLAGYKQPLWPIVFARMKAGFPEGFDVCVMSAGKYDSALDDLCRANNWSYLSTRTNDVSLVQNIAINLHPSADLIVKIDEDMFVTRNTISRCVDHYRAVKAEGIVNPGFVSPLINVNGVTYRPLLEHLGLLEEYQTRFGVPRLATLGVRATDDVEAAKWLWKKTAPLEETESKLASFPGTLLMSPVQFSIGLIVFERKFWEDINMLPVNWHRLMVKKSTLGADEEHVCRMTNFHARPIVICTQAIAGHFSFGRQYTGMLQFFSEYASYFA